MDAAIALSALLASWMLLSLSRAVAPALGLIDEPCERKVHSKPVPLAGGLAIVPVIIGLVIFFGDSGAETSSVVASMLLIFIVSILDDKFDLPATGRFGAQIIAASILVIGSGIQVTSLGNLFGMGEIQLGPMSTAFTIIAIVAAINAFNMIDGIDGLLGSIFAIMMTALTILFVLAGSITSAKLVGIAALAVLPFVYMNLTNEDSGKKIFMGDAGSMTLGLFASYMVIKGATTEAAYPPVGALYILAIPVFDIVRVSIARLARGISPFKAEKNHIHHILLAKGKLKALRLICLFSGVISSVGIALNYKQTTDATQLITLAVIFISLALYLRKSGIILEGSELKLVKQGASCSRNTPEAPFTNTDADQRSAA